MLRIMVLSVPTIILELMLSCRLLYRKRSVMPYAIWAFTRVFIQAVQYYFNGAYLFSKNGYTFYDWLFQATYTIGLVFLVIYTFDSADGTNVKTLMTTMSCDIVIGVLGWVLISPVNMLEGHEEVMMLYGAFQPLDLLVPIGMCVAMYCLYHFGYKLLDAFRDYKIKHKRLMSLCVFITYANSVITRIYIQNILEVIYISMFSILFLAMFGYMIRYDQHITLESEALTLSNHLLQDYYTDLSGHIHDMTAQKKEIDDMMKTLVIANFPAEKVQQYLTDMYEKRDVIAPASYTEYTIIDALLISKAEAYDQRDVRYEYHLNGLVLSKLSEIALCYLLMGVFRYLESLDTHMFTLHAFSIRNQVIIDVSLDQIPVQHSLKHFVSHSLTKNVFIDVKENAFSMTIAN